MSGPNNKLKAVGYLLTAVCVATLQDAIVKGLQGGYPTWEAVAFRGATATPIFLAWGWMKGINLFALPPNWKFVVVRAVILFTAYMAFALAIATLSLANAAAIYFTMPFFVALMSAHAIGERVPLFRWIAILIGFGGVLVSVRPGSDTFQPASFLALYAAFGYAIGQLLSRKVAQAADPMVIANMQSLFYCGGSIVLGLIVNATKIDASASPTFAAFTRDFAWPTLSDLSLMMAMGLASCISSVFFVCAYQQAPASFVAPFEYSAFLWSILYGIVGFGDYPGRNTLLGAAIVIAAGLFMVITDRKRQTTG